MWAFRNQKQSQVKAQRGFTIVELLIVVVVIAILAAITIVAYNGIQNRSKQSAAQSAVSQANKKVLIYAVDNTDSYPATLAAADVINTGDTTLQYSVNNSSSPKTYGITATNGTFSYYVSNTSPTPTAGGYPGHGVGGVAAVTNLVPNPNAATSEGYNFLSTSGQSSVNTSISSGGPSGGAFMRRTYNATSTAMPGVDIIYFGTAPWGGQSGQAVAPATSGQVFTLSAWVRSSKAQAVKLQIQWLLGSGSAGFVDGSSVTLTPNVWTRISATGTASATSQAVRLDIDGGTGAVPWVNGDTFDATSFMVTSGSTLHNYADGTSPSWVWNGTANSSTSTGPPL